MAFGARLVARIDWPVQHRGSIRPHPHDHPAECSYQATGLQDEELRTQLDGSPRRRFGVALHDYKLTT
jgi:hypothetical protein